MSTGRLVRIKIAFRTIKRALISCRSAEWKGCFGIFKRVDAYRRNVQLKRRCSGLESRERQLNRKITRPGEKPVRLSADKTNANLPRNLPRNQRNYRDRLSGGRVIVLFISLVFSLSLLSCRTKLLLRFHRRNRKNTRSSNSFSSPDYYRHDFKDRFRPRQSLLPLVLD